jgi:hypothetical protein
MSKQANDECAVAGCSYAAYAVTDGEQYCEDHDPHPIAAGRRRTVRMYREAPAMLEALKERVDQMEANWPKDAPPSPWLIKARSIISRVEG